MPQPDFIENPELFNSTKNRIDTDKLTELMTFELIQHRFTSVAKKFILKRFSDTKLDMDENKRVLKWGKFGRFKYVYPKERAVEIEKYLIS